MFPYIPIATTSFYNSYPHVATTNVYKTPPKNWLDMADSKGERHRWRREGRTHSQRRLEAGDEFCWAAFKWIFPKKGLGKEHGFETIVVQCCSPCYATPITFPSWEVLLTVVAMWWGQSPHASVESNESPCHLLQLYTWWESCWRDI